MFNVTVRTVGHSSHIQPIVQFSPNASSIVSRSTESCKVEGSPVFLAGHKEPTFTNFSIWTHYMVPLFGILCEMHVQQVYKIQFLQIQGRKTPFLVE